GQLASEEEIRRFRTEAEAAAHLDHPNIVPIYEIAEDGGWEYFTMKLIDGGSLASKIAAYQVPNGTGATPRHHAAVVRERLSAIALLIGRTARAIHYAHQRGLLHRDLKPA